MNKELDQVLVNEYYQRGYKNGYKRGSNLNYNDQNKNNDSISRTPYISVTYYTYVVTLVVIFIIFVILSYNSNYIKLV
jgi:hypothetical protein